MPQPVAMQVVSRSFPLHQLEDHPGSLASAGESQQNLQLPGVIVAPIPAEGGRKAMRMRLKCPLVPPLSA